MKKNFIVAIDVGGTSGKIAAATYENKKITLRKLINFENPSIINKDAHSVDVVELFRNINNSLRTISQIGKIEAFGIDTWGGSYGYINNKGDLNGDVYNCRDSRTIISFQDTRKILSDWEIYKRTGQRNTRFSVLSHMHKDQLDDNRLLFNSETMLLMPSLLTYLFTGTICCERTMASTTCLADPTGSIWDYFIIDKLNIPRNLFPKIARTGTLNGFVSSNIRQEIGGNVKVFNTAGHDTAAALAILPVNEHEDCFISIGTTIVIGCITNSPVISIQSLNRGFRNSVDGYGRNILSVDVTGFWIINEIRKILLTNNQPNTYDKLNYLASQTEGNESFIDPCSEIFKSSNENLLNLISSYLSDRGQKVPKTLGQLIRCVFESYVMRIKFSIQNLQKILNISKFKNIYVISGGTRNNLLMQMIADALDQEIIVGTPWATLFGNLFIQMLGMEIIDKKDVLEISSNSCEHTVTVPMDSIRWQENFERLVTNEFFKN